MPITRPIPDSGLVVAKQAAIDIPKPSINDLDEQTFPKFNNPYRFPLNKFPNNYYEDKPTDFDIHGNFVGFPLGVRITVWTRFTSAEISAFTSWWCEQNDVEAAIDAVWR